MDELNNHRKQQKRANQSTTDASSEAFATMLRQAEKAESYVAGCLLTESTAISRVAEILKPECFFTPALKVIFQTVYDLWRSGQQPDLMNVTAAVIRQGKIDQVGGPYGISQMATAVGSSTNLEEHAMYVRQCYTQRQLADAGVAIHTMGMDTTADVGDQVAQSLKLLEGILNDMDYQNPLLNMQETTRKALREYERKVEMLKKGKPYGLKSGLQTLDKFLHGFKPGELIVVGARPAMGKTALLLHFAKSIAAAGNPIAIFSLEMSDISLTNRLILSVSNINSDAFKDGRLTPDEEEKMIKAAGRVSELPIWVDETPGMSVDQIKIRALNLKRKKGLAAIGIDYLQLMNTKSENRSYNREQEISMTTRKLKQLAKELEVPIILLSQLNRNIDQKTTGGVKETQLPRLSDLRESGAIEQDADVVLMIHRPEYYEDTNAIPGVGLVVIAKQRDGQTGKVLFGYSDDMTKIRDVSDDGRRPVNINDPLPF